MFFVSTGTCSVVKVGRLCMDEDEVVENVMETLNGVVEVLPGKWKYVRSLHLKLSESVSLPIYQSVPELKLKIEGSEEESGDVKEEKKKGRIHEVRYMDSNVSEVIGDVEVSIESKKKKRKKEVSAVDEAEKPKKKVAKGKRKEMGNEVFKPKKNPNFTKQKSKRMNMVRN